MGIHIGSGKTHMHNTGLVQDHLKRSEHRLAAVELLYKRKSWADVVRESQEVVELVLKALLRASNIEVPRIHDVSAILEEQEGKLPAQVRGSVSSLVEISRTLRRDRELAFYGSEDLTPSDFYKETDAKKAFDMAKQVFTVVSKALP